MRHAEADGSGSEWSMLLRRLSVYRYRVRMPKPQKPIAPCAHCFAQFLFQAEEQWQRRL